MAFETEQLKSSLQEDESPREGIYSTIRAKLPSLSKSHQKIGQYILNHPREIIFMSITELAEKAGVGEATVSRFCWNLDLRGFQELKLSLAQDNSFLLSSQSGNHEGLQIDSITEDIARRMIQVIESTCHLIDEVTMNKACELLAAARKIDFYGVGTSGVIANDASQMFLGIGKNTTAYPDPHVQVMSAALLTSKDVALAISQSGSTKDTVTSLRKAKESGAHTISVTSYARSPITQVSDLVLLTAMVEKVSIPSVYAKIGEMVILERLYWGCRLILEEEAQSAQKKITSAIMDKLY